MTPEVVVRSHGDLPLRGHVVWLTAEQGGRASGPPPTPAGFDYVSTGYVPPHGLGELASFVLRVEDRTAWRSPATGRWLAFDNVGAQAVRAGSVVVITEGPVRVVAYFHVTELDAER